MKKLSQVKDLTGQKFGRLTVIGVDPQDGRKTYWFCQCDCGNMKRVRSDILQAGRTKSCGCLKLEQDRTNLSGTKSKAINKERGYMSGKTRLYSIWTGMRARCNNKNSPSYDRYGARGIRVCEEWDDFGKFHDWALENGYDDKLTIDRIDNNGNYEPNNCRWADAKEQSRNRRSNVNITIGNATKTITEWCEVFGLEPQTILARHSKNEDISLDELFKG